MNEIATSKSWKNIPMRESKSIKTDLIFKEVQFERIKKGFIPQQMEDKWFSYFENDWLHLIRSWTGIEIYKAKIERHDKEYVIKELQVVIDPVNYHGADDDSEKETFTAVVFPHLLRE